MYKVVEKDNIENMIYEIRGVQVMLDSDLARLYECSNGTKVINQAVKRNIDRFPNDFYFQLSHKEYEDLKSQFVTSSAKTYGGVRKMPYAFTEQGVAMLATIIHTKIASKVSVDIMRAFVKMRHFIIENKNIYKSLNNINNALIEHDEKINYLFSKFDKKGELVLKDKPYSAYKTILDILNTATKEIIVIDSYADITFLDLIRNIKCNVVLITRDSNRLSNIEIEKYNKEYHNLKVIRNNDFHDRCIIIDNKDLYLCGSSINNLGNKVSTILKVDDFMMKNDLKEIVKKIEKY